jgi:N-dimethylarginine dimethylaminohydrolase
VNRPQAGGVGAIADSIDVRSEWAELKECIYGWAGQFILPRFLHDVEVRASGDVGVMWRENEGRDLKVASPSIHAEFSAHVNGAVEFLRKFGVVVHQPIEQTPQNLLYPRGENHGSMTGWMRDPFVTIGSNVIELAPRTLFHRRQRFCIRHILFDTMTRGARYFAQPDGGAEDNETDCPGFGYLEGGDIFVLGKKILVGNSGNCSNADGARWLQHVLGAAYDVELVRIDPRMSHLDIVLMTPREGLAVVCTEAFPDGLPRFLESWEKIEIPFKAAKYSVAINQLVLNDRTVLLPSESEHDHLASALKSRGFDVPRIPYKGVYQFGGSFRCAYQPLRRV